MLIVGNKLPYFPFRVGLKCNGIMYNRSWYSFKLVLRSTAVPWTLKKIGQGHLAMSKLSKPTV